MGAMIRYLRQNPLQRRVLSLAITMVVGAGAALVLYGPVRDALLIARLGSADAAQRAEALGQAKALAAVSPAFVARLESALETPDDERFANVVAALRYAGQFRTPARAGAVLDRAELVWLRRSRPADANEMTRARMRIIERLLLGGRDNAYVRQAAATAADDPVPRVRHRAALLASAIGDVETLRSLLGDEDPEVVGAAAADAGVAGLDALAGEIADLLKTSAQPASAGGAAWGLARLRPEACDPLLAARIDSTPPGPLLDRLLHAASSLDAPACRTAVAKRLTRAGDPPAMALAAALRMRLPEAGAVGRDLLRRLETGQERTVGQVYAAVGAVRAAGLPAREPLVRLLTDQWQAGHPLLLAEAARAIGEQIDLPPADPNAPADATLRQVLRQAALWAGPPGAETAAGRGLGSAAAAVACWLDRPTSRYLDPKTPDPNLLDFLRGEGFDPNASAFAIQEAAAGPGTLPGDYIAWHVGRSGRREAFELGLAMLPELDAPPWAVVTDPNVRSAGAMLLAISARKPEARKRAARRIEQRLVGGPLGGERDPYAIGAYRCALLICGQTDQAEAVFDLLVQPEFPQRRAFTALALAGDRRALDWMLADPFDTAADVVMLYVHTALGEVLGVTAPSLPVIDVAADAETRLWQATLLRDTYLLRRESVRFGPPQ